MDDTKKLNRYFNHLEKTQGGYFGEDVTEISKEIGVSENTVRRFLEKEEYIYISKRSTGLTNLELEKIEKILLKNPLYKPTYILQDLGDNIKRRTFYDALKRIYQKLNINLADPTIWLKMNGVRVSKEYSVETARKSLETTFTLYGTPVKHISCLLKVMARVSKCKEVFEQFYPDCDYTKYAFTKELLLRRKVIKSQLTSLNFNEKQPAQARLIFEYQVKCIIEFTDFLISMIILKHKNVLTHHKSTRYELDVYRSGQSENVKLHAIKHQLKAMASKYEQLEVLLSYVTDNYSGKAITCHTDKAKLVVKCLQLGDFHQKQSIHYYAKLDENFKRFLLLRSVIQLIEEGEITFNHSYQFFDVSERIKNQKNANNYLNSKGLDQMITGQYKIDISLEEPKKVPNLLKEKITFSEARKQVYMKVYEVNKDYFENHLENFRKMTDNIFDFMYGEDEFKQNISDGLSFFGLNLKYHNEADFMINKYFHEKYINDQALDLEHKHLFNTIRSIIPTFNDQIIIIDTKSAASRKTSHDTRLHGRYKTVGYTDLRGMFWNLYSAYCNLTLSNETEATNIAEVLYHCKKVLGIDLKVYIGDAHTTTKSAAAISYLAFDIISAARHTVKHLDVTEEEIEKIKKNMPLLNQLGRMVSKQPELGRIILSKKVIMVDGENLVEILESFGKLVLFVGKEHRIKLNRIIQLIEVTNRTKRVLQAYEKGIIRTYADRASIILKSGELAVDICRLYTFLKTGEMCEFDITKFIFFVAK